MSTVGEVFMTVVAPVVGMTLANVMFFSGVPAMLRCKRDGALGDMNPAPFPVVLANCVGWMGYAILAQDFFVFFGAAPGSIIGLFFTIVGYGLTPHGSDMRVYLENVVSLLAVALVAVTFYVGFVARLFFTIDPEGTHERSVMGLFCNAVLVLYYSSPLSTIKTVLVEKNA
jgi:solute carrier family 50 protein (sugar transporter)